MPTYEYRCAAGHQYEKREGFEAPAKQKCEKCGKPASRLIFAPPIVFKGSGFYKTDNRGSSAPEPSSDGAKSESTTKPSSDGHGHSHAADGSHADTASPDSADTVESAAAS